MATFNYEVKVSANFDNFEKELKSAVGKAKTEFQKINEEWSDITIDIPIDKDLSTTIKKQLSVIKKYAPEIEPKIDIDYVRKLLDEYTQLKIAIDTKDATKAFDLLKEKFAELNKLYEPSINKPKEENYHDKYEYEDALSEYKARISERNDKVADILNDILNYSETLINHKVIDRQSFSEALNSGLMQNNEILDDVLGVMEQKGISLSGGKEISKLKEIIEALNKFADLDSRLEKVDTSGMKNAAEQLAESKETRKQRKEQAEIEKANQPKKPPKNSLKLDANDLNNRIDSTLSETAEAAEKAENSIKELNSVAIKINTDEFDELYEQLNKLQSEPIVLKASVDPEVKEQLENLLKIKEDLIASGTINLELSTNTINSVNDLREKILSLSESIELKGDVSEQFKTSINELKDTLDSITKKSRTIRFKISEATNRDITELNERLNSLSQKLIAESKEVSNVLETTAKQSEVSISNIPTVKINVNADSIDELAYKIISLEELLNSVVTVKGKVDDSIYTELETLKAKLNAIEEKQRLINFKINDNIDSQITELKDRLDKLVTDRVLDGNFKIDASVVSALSDNGDIVNNLQKIDETLNNVIDTMKALNSISDNVQENILSMGVDAINQMSSALDRLISRINVLLGYEVAPEEVDKVRKMLSNAQKSRKLNAETRKPLKASNAKLNALSHADEVDHNALRQALDEAYSLLGVNPNVEKIKEVPVYVERTAKATKKATETTKEYAEQQESFNNSLKEYKAHMNAIAGLNIDPAFDAKKAAESQKAIESSLNAIAKSSDLETKEDLESFYIKLNSDEYNKFGRVAFDKLSKINSQITNSSVLSSSETIIEKYESLQKRLNEINESELSPGFILNFYSDLQELNNSISSELSKSKTNVSQFNDTLKQYKTYGNSITKFEPIDNSITKINELKSRLDEIIGDLDEETGSKLKKELESINNELEENFNANRLKQIEKLQELAKNPLYTSTDKLDALINDLQKVESTDYEKIYQISESIQELFNSIAPETIKEGNLTKLYKIIGDLKAYTSNPKYSGIPSELKQQGNVLLGEANKLLNDGFSSEQLKELNAQVVAYKGEIGKLGKTMSTTASVAFKLSEMNARFIAQFFSFYDLIRYGREFLNVIVEIDTAVGELRKVSNETDERLAASLKTSTKTAKELGASISEIVNATSDWSRLGYGIDEAEQLAKVSQLYVNVGDGIDMDSANESLISTLQGFQLPVDEAESIIDKFNEVANNYAIDTAGIGEALQRSAASFYAANTDLSKSIALVTTANTVLQNPDTVGTTFKTLSARLRGASTELEVLGEETDEYVETTSKLRDLVKSLTGFDIMEDENTFKDIYDILVGIGKEWNNLTDVERASLGEALAGKRNSNALFAVLQNVDLLESVYETAENSAGSAAREQENYAKTIQYSINVFKASAQELATQILDSSVVKSVVDSGTNLINALMNLGAILSPIVSLLGEALSIILKIASVVSSNPIGAMFEIGAIAKYIIYLRNVSSAKNADTVATIAEKAAVDSETVSETANTTAKNANVASSNALSLAMIREAFQANGLTGVIKALTAAYTGLSTASKIALGIAAGFAIFEIGKKVVDAFTTSTAELKQKAEESAQEVSELESKLSSIETRINALNDKKSLSFVEQDELDKLNETKASLEAQLKLKQLIAAEDAKKVEESAVDDYKSATVRSDYTTVEDNRTVPTKVAAFVSPEQEFQSAIDAYYKAKESYEEAIANGQATDSQEAKKYKNEMDRAKEQAGKIASTVSKNAEGITGVTQEGKEILENVSKVSSQYELLLADVNGTAIDALSESAKRLYLVNKASESNVGSDIISYLSKNISAEEIDKLLHLDGFTFDKVKTLDDLKNLLHDVKDEVYKNTPLNVTTMLTESDKKDGNQVSLKDLKEEASVLKTLEDELKEKTRFSVDTMKEIASYYPEAESSLRDYMLGLIDETTLFEKLKEVYQEDAEKYNDVLKTELLSTRQFTEKVLNNNVDLYNAIKDVYGEDYVNFKTLAEMKYDVDHNLIKTLLSEWAGYADVMSNMTDGLSYEQYEAQLDAEVAAGKISEEMMAEYLQAWSTANNWDKVSKSPEVEKYFNLKDKINSALNSLSASDYDLPDVSWETIGVLKGGDSDSGSSSQPKIFDWYERFINNIARAYSRLKTVVSDTTTVWLNRNNALEESMGVLSKEISAQQKAYEFYISMFEQSSISAEYKDLIKNGALRSDSISDSNLADEIQNAIDWYDKAQDALDQVQSLGIELKELSKTRFDNVKSEYEEFINQIEHSTSMLQNQQDLLEAQGYLASTALYSNLITTEQKNLETLRAEYHALVNAMNQFTGEKYSETWYDMQSDINSVAEAIQEAQKQLVEYNNEMRQVKWDSFDRVRDTVQDIIDESEFMYGLLEKNKLLDEKGYFNANGVAAQALLAEKYNVYMNQADAYSKEILEIDKELATDPYNTKLIDRRQELLEAQRDAINGANSEKDALKDLIEEAYNAQLDSLQKIIDKYKEMMQTAKDAYDYEKNVGDQVQTIASLEKQLNAYTLDNSEEGMLRRQQLTAELEEAKEQLQETEYERLISDTENLLDQITTEFEDWMNARLDNVDLLLQEVINQSNANASSINDTIQTTANEVGYTLTSALSNIWNGSSGLKEIMILYQNDFNNQATTINNSINSIGQAVINILNKANETSEQIINDVKNGTNSVSNAINSHSSASTPSTNNQQTSNSSNSSSRVSEDIFWHKRDSYPKSMLNINTSIVDRLKYNDFDSSFNARAHYWESLFGGAYTGSYSQNVQMLDWLKQNGYAKGIRRLHSSMNGYAWTNEDGEELIRTSDGAILTPVGNGGTVFNNKMTDTLWDFAKNPADYIKDYDTTTVLREGTSQTIDVGGFNIQVVANNPEEFARGLKNVMAKDTKAQKMIQEIVLGQTIGNNTLSRNKYL